MHRLTAAVRTYLNDHLREIVNPNAVTLCGGCNKILVKKQKFNPVASSLLGFDFILFLFIFYFLFLIFFFFNIFILLFVFLFGHST